MTPALYALGGACARRPWAVLGIWIVLLVGVVFGAKAIGQSLNDNLTLPGTDSQAATDLLNDKFPDQANGSVPVVFVAPDGKKVEDSPFKKQIEDVVDRYEKDSAVNSVVSPFSKAGSSQVSSDHSTAYAALSLNIKSSDLTEDDAQAILDKATPAAKHGLQVSIGGYVGDALSTASSDRSEGIGLLAAIIILLLTFGSLVAMSMPIVMAIFGLGVGLSLLTVIGTVVDVPSSAPSLATMIGMGVGIDYGLFVVSQHREFMAEGRNPHESAARATATAGGAVVFAGGTVIIALLSLLVAGLPLISALGYSAALVVLVAMLAAITLLPALLALVGERIHFGRLPWHKVSNPAEFEGAWHRWARQVARHRWIAILSSVAVLVVLTIPALSMSLGQIDDGSAPEGSQARLSYDALSSGFGAGFNGPLLVAVDLSQKPAKNDSKQLKSTEQKQQQLEAAGMATPEQEQQLAESEQFYKSKSSDPRLQDLMNDLKKTKGVKTVSQPDVNDSGTAAIYSVISKTAPDSEATSDLVNDLRSNVLPSATKGKDMTAHVGGATAGYIDLASEISDNLPHVIALVLVLSFFLLMLAFRSLLVPLKAVLMNLFSIGASFGVVTYVFTHDWSAQLVGLEGSVPIVSFVPLMMFAILFGLSMDYEVFLMTHVREQFMLTGDADEAVVEGLAGTARVITSAALIMVSVFCAFVLSEDAAIKQFGVGMAAAVLIDATIVRCALVPGIMRVLGNAAWWLPRWLERGMPHFSIEGREWFEELDKRQERRPGIT